MTVQPNATYFSNCSRIYFVVSQRRSTRLTLMDEFIVTAEMTNRQTQQALNNYNDCAIYHLSDVDAISQRERLIAADKLPPDEPILSFE